MGASESKSLHHGHSLTEHHYDGEDDPAATPCAVCECIIAGAAGYRCVGGGGCCCGEGEDGSTGFNVHVSCLSLPTRIAFDEHPADHGALTLSLLTARRWCRVCRVTSSAGCYMYRCAACDFDVHPRCTALMDGGEQEQEEQEEEEEQRRNGRKRGVAKRVGKAALKVGFFGLRVADVVTGGFGSPVIDVVEAALHL